MATDRLINVVPAAAKTATGNSGALSCDGYEFMTIMVDLGTYVSTPSVTMSVEWSIDGVNFFAGESPVAFAAITSPGKRSLVNTRVFAPYYRVVWTITGGTSPSVTIAVWTYLNGQVRF